MPYSKIIPVTQVRSWNREGTPPSLVVIRAIFEQQFSLINYITFTINYENTLVEWLSAPYNEYGYISSDGELQLFLQNTNDLANGTYRANVIVTAVYEDLSEITLNSEVNLILSGTAPTAVTTDKTNYNVLYNRETNSITGDTHVTIINNTALDNLSFETIGTLFNELTATEDFDLVEDPLAPFSTNAELPTSGTVVVSCKLRKAGVFIYGFTITLTVLESDEIIVNPDSLEFTLRKGFNETKSATLTLTNPLNHAFTIAKPSWLTLSANAGSSSAAVTVETDNSDTFDIGEISDFITVSYGSKIIQIPVKLTVIAFIDINTTEYNFCLDDVILKVFKMNETARFVRVKMKMKFTTAAGETDVESAYQIPYFEDKVNTDVGEKIQNFFPVFQGHLFGNNTVNFDNRIIYKAAAVQLIIEELDINYTVLHTSTLSDLDFYAGHRPKQFPLFTNYPIRRKYSGSTFFFSYLTDLVGPESFTTQIATSNPVSAKEVQAVKLIEGELLEDAELKNNLGVELLPFPNVESQVVLQWLNNNLVPEWMILSGTYRIDDAYEHISDSFAEGGQKYDTTETQKLTISTGFILKEETQMIKEIIKSKISYIKLENEIYKTLSVSPKFVELERQKNLINIELEFVIVK